MHIEGATRLFHRDENGVLMVDARIYGSMSRELQREVEDELRRDIERRREAADKPIVAAATEPAVEDAAGRLRDPLDSVGDALLEAGRSLAEQAEKEQALAAVKLKASNQLVDAARLLHARATRICGD